MSQKQVNIHFPELESSACFDTTLYRTVLFICVDAHIFIITIIIFSLGVDTFNFIIYYCLKSVLEF